jgi:hypothetical protein
MKRDMLAGTFRFLLDSINDLFIVVPFTKRETSFRHDFARPSEVCFGSVHCEAVPFTRSSEEPLFLCQFYLTRKSV